MPSPPRPGTALVPVDVVPDPILAGLTALQHAFALSFVKHSDGNAARAAREAGYLDPTSAGWRLLQNRNVQDAIRQLTAVEIATSAPIAAMVMRRLALSAKSEFVQQQAASDLLDRAGFKPPDRHQHLVAGSVTISIDLGD